MSRTLADLTAGTLIYLDETVSGTTNHIPYIYLGLDENGNGRLLRQYAPLNKRMHSSNASYAGSEMDTWLEDSSSGFLSRFDTDTINALNYTSIKYVDYNQSSDTTAEVLEISRRCFLLSYSEVGFGNDSAGNEGQSYFDVLKTFTGLTTNMARVAYNESGTAVGSWLRSAYSTTYFRSVDTGGSASYGNASHAGYWPRPALSVAPATIVSDEGADTIFLLPDTRTTTWNVDMNMSLGESTNRPSQAKVEVATSDISSLTIQITNNYGDSSPVWTTIQNGSVATLTNATKTTDNWEVGIKINAASTVPSGYIGEPVVLIATD